eukprot:g61748.t1
MSQTREDAASPRARKNKAAKKIPRTDTSEEPKVHDQECLQEYLSTPSSYFSLSSTSPTDSAHARMKNNASLVFQGIKGLVFNIRQEFALDFRSLAMFRIMLGICTLYVAYVTSQDISVFYSDEIGDGHPSLVPRERNWNMGRPPGAAPGGPQSWLAVHDLSGSVQAAYGLLLIQVISAFCLTIGYHSRLACLVCWVFKCSLNGRNMMIMNGMDALHKLCLWWALLLPVDRVWAFDNKSKFLTVAQVLSNRKQARAQSKGKKDSAKTKGASAADAETDKEAKYGEDLPNRSLLLEDQASLASLYYAVQIHLLYYCSAVLKWSPKWWQDGTAAWYALHHDLMIKPLVAYALAYTPSFLLTWGTIYTWYLEKYGGLLFLLPIYTPALRTLGVMLFCKFHLLNHALMYLCVFPWLGVASTLVLLPPEAWRAIALSLATSGVPGTRRVALMIDPEAAGEVEPAPLPPPQKEEPRTVCDVTLSGVSTFWACLSFLFILIWNLDTIGVYVNGPPAEMIKAAEPFVDAMGWKQKWDMFAPCPVDKDGWWVFIGEVDPVEGGLTQVSLWDFLMKDPQAWPAQLNEKGIYNPHWLIRNSSSVIEKGTGDRAISATMKTTRWTMYLQRIWDPNDLFAERPHFAEHICRKWNKIAQAKFGPKAYPTLHNFTVWWMDEPSLHPFYLPEGAVQAPVTGPYRSWWYDCDSSIYWEAHPGNIGSTRPDPRQQAIDQEKNACRNEAQNLASRCEAIGTEQQGNQGNQQWNQGNQQQGNQYQGNQDQNNQQGNQYQGNQHHHNQHQYN